MNYRAEIDGLRALAIVPVVFFHTGFTLFSGGFVGVDIFFVISGYLITTILLSELKAGTFTPVNFYARRARRILPALFFVILISVPIGWMLLTPSELLSFSKSISAVALFVSNFFFWKDGSYFETSAELKPLLHTWSLAVEEQYYIFFPPFLVALWRFGKNATLWTIIIVALISFSIAQVGSTWKPVANFFLLPSRAWELGIGAVSALILLEYKILIHHKHAKQLLSMCGFFAIIFSVFIFDKDTPIPSIYALLPTIGTVFIILFAHKDTYIGILLGSRPFVSIGLISYSAYLWHHPILAYSKVGIPLFGVIPKVPLLAFIVFVSILSFKYIESPFRNCEKFGTKFIYKFSISLIAFFGFFGIYSYNSIRNIDYEASMARELMKGVAIYVSNMNERTFVKSRIEVETILPKTVVLGSSRIMQISSKFVGNEILNLGVSGASVEDDVAIWSLVSKKFDPDLVLIGADPWLFNAKSGQERWRTLEPEYYSARSEMGIPSSSAPTIPESDNNSANSLLIDVYRFLHLAKVSATNDTPELIDKIRRDGSRVYNLTYANKSKLDIEASALSYASYAMTPYEYSAEAEDAFRKLIKNIKKRRAVILILSPYHPKLYRFMLDRDHKFLEIENKFNELGASLGISVVGSYNPEAIGCNDDEFYDAMHPKDSCMDKLIRLLK